MLETSQHVADKLHLAMEGGSGNGVTSLAYLAQDGSV